MYAFIRGTVDDIGMDRAVLDAGGVGYELFCSSQTLKTLLVGAKVKLYTHLHLADGVQALYGFADEEERAAFRRLIGVGGVGPKLALSVLSTLTPSDVRAAIVTGNASVFEQVKGMGKKIAQRVVSELGDAVRSEVTNAPLAKGGKQSPPDIQTEAVAALTSLGYDGLTASRAVTSVSEASSVEELITKALRSMAKG